MLLYFVRHGEPNYETDSLTEKGQMQANEVCARLCAEGFSKIFSSPLGRAQKTAKPLADAMGLPIQILPFMEEIRTGAPKGTKEEEAKHYFPWSRFPELVKKGENLLTYDYDADPYWKNSPVKADFEKVAKEADLWLESLGFRREGDYYRCIRENAEKIALFAHGAVGTAFAAHLLSLPMMYCCAHFQFGYCGVTVYRLEGKAGELICPSLLQLNGSQYE